MVERGSSVFAGFRQAFVNAATRVASVLPFVRSTSAYHSINRASKGYRSRSKSNSYCSPFRIGRNQDELPPSESTINTTMPGFGRVGYTSGSNRVAASSHNVHSAATALHSITACRQNSIQDRRRLPAASSPRDEPLFSFAGMLSKRSDQSDARRTGCIRELKPWGVVAHECVCVCASLTRAGMYGKVRYSRFRLRRNGPTTTQHVVKHLG